jgi:phosphate transport system permease protein
MNFDRSTRRKIVDRTVTALALLCVVAALIPLGSIIYTAVARGIQVMSIHFLVGAEPQACTPGVTPNCQFGGIGPAIEGTLVLLALSSLIVIPLGILIGIFVSEYGLGRTGRVVSFFTEVMSGIPSIIVGVFVYSMILLLFPSIVFSTISGSAALAIIMLPIVARTTEEALHLVPATIREAALALGIPKYRTTLRVVLSAGRSAVITGAMLAVMRAGGETAPLLFTAFGNRFGFQGLTQPVEAVPPIIYYWGLSPFGNWVSDAWGAALVLILIMLGISVAARLALRQRFAAGV